MYTLFVVWTGINSALRSLDFVVVHFLMKLFSTVTIEIIHDCCSYFKFLLPIEMLVKRRVKFRINFMQYRHSILMHS